MSLLCGCNKNDLTPDETLDEETTSASIPESLPTTDDNSYTDENANPASDFEYELSTNKNYVYITKYIGTDEHVVIPSQIDDISVSVIKGIYYPSTGETVGAFQNSSIRSVVIPNSIASIHNNAFSDCQYLSQITFLPNSNLKFISSAFENCVALKKIDLSLLPLEEIGTCTFSGCTNLKEITLPNALLKIGEHAFYECSSLLEINLPQNLVEIGRNAFNYCTSLRTITIPPNLSLVYFNSIPFDYIPSLEKIIFENGRDEINGTSVFVISSDAEIIIPKSVKKFSPYAFYIYDSAKFIFWGDCPEIVEQETFYGNPTIFYDPTTKGWDECVWKDTYNLEPIQ